MPRPKEGDFLRLPPLAAGPSFLASVALPLLEGDLLQDLHKQSWRGFAAKRSRLSSTRSALSLMLALLRHVSKPLSGPRPLPRKFQNSRRPALPAAVASGVGVLPAALRTTMRRRLRRLCVSTATSSDLQGYLLEALWPARTLRSNLLGTGRRALPPYHRSALGGVLRRWRRRARQDVLHGTPLFLGRGLDPMLAALPPDLPRRPGWQLPGASGIRQVPRRTALLHPLLRDGVVAAVLHAVGRRM